MACELTSICIFFNDQMQGKPAMLALYKAQYCHADNSQCARYTVYLALGRDAVPRDMYPNDRLRALRVVRLSVTKPDSTVSVPEHRSKTGAEDD